MPRGSQGIEGTEHTAATPIQDMTVNHGRPNIVMPEQFLDGSYVVAGFQQVSGETVSQAVAGCRFGSPAMPDGFLHRFLHDRFMQMMPPLYTQVFINVPAGCREYPLPSPLASRVRILSRKRIRKGDRSRAFRQVPLMQLAYGLQMRQQPILCSARQHCDSVLAAFAVTNNNLTAVEVQILHPQFQTLHQTQ